MKLSLTFLLLTGLIFSVHAQSASAEKTVVNNQFFYDSNPHPENLELWDYQKAVFGKYDRKCHLFLSGVVDQIDRVADKEFRYFVYVDDGFSGGRNLIVGLVPQLVDSIQPGTSVSIFGQYKDTQASTYTAGSTGLKETVDLPEIDVAGLGHYVSGVGIKWLYVLK